MSTRKRIPRYNQASKIIARFGGVTALAASLGYDRTAVHKWTVPRAQHGTDGMVPSSAQEKVRQAARLHGILLSPDDWAVTPYVLPRVSAPTQGAAS